MIELEKEEISSFPIQNQQDDSIIPKSKETIKINNKNNIINQQFLILNDLLNVTVRQVITFLNKTSYCANNIKYQIYNEKNYIFSCKEETTFCQRKCCNYYCRNLKFKLFSNKDKLGYCNKLFENSYFFPQSHLKIKYYLNEKVFIIKESYTYYESNFTIFDENNKIKYLLKFQYYQWGFCYRYCSSSKHRIIVGNLYENGILLLNNAIVGYRIKDNQYNDFIFNINFPINMNIYDKFNIIICSILFHYKYFSIKESKRCYQCKWIIIILLICIIVILFIFFLIIYLSKKSFG